MHLYSGWVRLWFYKLFQGGKKQVELLLLFSTSRKYELLNQKSDAGKVDLKI